MIVSRVVDLLDPSLNTFANIDLDGGAAPRAERRPGVRARHRRVVCPRRLGGHHRPHGAVDGSPAAILPRQAPRGPGAVRRRPHRHAARGARSRRPGRAVPPELHAHGAGALRRRPGARRLSRSRSGLHAFLHAAAGLAPRRISTRSAAATSARSPTRSPSGCIRIDAGSKTDPDRRRVLGRHRQRIGVPRDVSRDAPPRAVAVAAQGVRAGLPTARTSHRRGPFCRRSACRCSSRRFPRPPATSIRAKPSACSRTTSRSTSNARRWA